MCTILLFILASSFHFFRVFAKRESLEVYLTKAVKHAESRILDAINPPHSSIGSLKAALSRTCPNYAYTWTRDQALVYTTILNKYKTTKNSTEQAHYEAILKDYATYSHTIYALNQGLHTRPFTLDGIASPSLNSTLVSNYGKTATRNWTVGEAKYEMNGGLYNGKWCSPQNDGPALRAILLMEFAKKYLSIHGSVDEGGDGIDTNNYVKLNLFSPSMEEKVKTPIKRDLEFVRKHWNDENCEPWEEIKGKHFYNRILARRAMKMGAEFTKSVDPAASQLYLEEVPRIEIELENHWDDELHTIRTTIGKGRYDDIQTVFATLHSYSHEDNFYAATGDYVLANALYTLKAFDKYFVLNQLNWRNRPDLGVAIGRYTGDIYNGWCPWPASVCPKPCLGQAWFLATNAMAELLFQSIKIYLDRGSISINRYNKDFFIYFGAAQLVDNKKLPLVLYSTSKEFQQLITLLIRAGDSFLKRTQYHSGQRVNYRLDEQYNTITGRQMSAGDLTWSYASLVTAKAARDSVQPDKLISSFTEPNSVQMEFILTNVPLNYTLVVLSGNLDRLGYGKTCEGSQLFKRKTVGGSEEWSAISDIPHNEHVQLRAYGFKKITNIGNCPFETPQYLSETIKFQTGNLNPVDAVYIPFTKFD